MNKPDIDFMNSVQEAVDKSLQRELPLVVYSTEGNDTWLKEWLTRDVQQEIKDKCVALKLVKGTDQFQYFEQVFPSIPIPCVCCIASGKMIALIKGSTDMETHAHRLLSSLGCTLAENIQNSDSKKEPESELKSKIPSTLKEQAAETAARIYHDQLLKQRKIEKEERERIKRLVKADREEFKAKERQKVANRLGHDDIRDNIKCYGRLHTDNCILLIRLLNGRSISHEFESSMTLNSVRKWVDKNRTDGDDPYSFHRSIPRITFTDSDEMKTLVQLELTPRSALILKPLENENNKHGIVDAQGPGLLGRAFNSLTSWWSDPKAVSHHDHDASSKSHSSYSGSAASPSSSKYVSPLHSPYMNTDPNISELSLPSRPVSPNVYLFTNTDDDKLDEDRKTFNGNNVKLEDKKDD